ncbi:MAG: penicillin acylase family protein, partial [Pseudomonadota bacterium]
TVGERTFPMYHTHHGPITHSIDGNWVATKINWDPVNALTQSYTRTKLENYAEFREMMNIRTNSSNNTVFADGEGNIAYFHGNFMPRRDSSFDYSKPVDGSNPDTDWQGLHSVDEMITILNPPNGYIQNANSTPFTAAAEYSPKRDDYPAYMAPDFENFRGVHALRVLSKIDDLTLDNLIELAHDPYLPGFEALLESLSAAWDSNGDAYPQLVEPIKTLRDWDFATGKASIAMTLAHFYGQQLLSGTKRERGTSEMALIESLARDLPAAAQLDALNDVVDRLEADFGTWQTPWGDVNRFQRLTGDIDLAYDDSKPSIAIGMANSRWGALADFGASRRDGTKKLYGSNGNSFVAVVEFGETLRAKTILVGGQSNDPNSPHFSDQAPLYADHKFKDVAFYRDDIERRAAERYAPGERKQLR